MEKDHGNGPGQKPDQKDQCVLKMLPQAVFVPGDQGEQVSGQPQGQKGQQDQETGQYGIRAVLIVQLQKKKIAGQGGDSHQGGDTGDHPLLEIAAKRPEIGPGCSGAAFQSQVVHCFMQRRQRRADGYDRYAAHQRHHCDQHQVRQAGQGLEYWVV